jgi:O-antigen/teichoic acid export membrane protein
MGHDKTTSPEQPQVTRDVPQNLRHRVVRGGAAFAIRQGIGIGLSVLNVLVVTHIIGPYQYGLYAAPNAIVAFIAVAATWGLDVYLLRKTEEPTRDDYDQAFTIFLITSIAFVAMMVIFRTGLAKLIGIPELGLPLAVMSLYIPLNLLNLPGVVKLDRALAFERVAFNELAGQVMGYAVAVPLAFAHFGCWAPIAGLLAGQVVLFVLIYVAAPMRLRLHWEPRRARDMLGYGLGYSGAVWIWQLRALVNPLIVGRFAGAQGVGFVALAIRLVEVLAFIRLVTWRIAMATLAKFGHDTEKLRRSITEGMSLQAFAVGLPLTAFAAIGPLVLPRLFGSRWDPSFRIFPFLALSYLLTAVFNLHVSVLALLRHNFQLMRFYAVHVLAFALSAALLIPRLGYIGYGWAEVAGFAAYLLLHVYVTRSVGSPDYRRVSVWFFACSATIVLSCLPSQFRAASILLLGLPLLSRAQRDFLADYIRVLCARRPRASRPAES